MKTWTLELSAHVNQTSPPGAKLMAAHQQGKKVVAWWYTCLHVHRHAILGTALPRMQAHSRCGRSSLTGS